MSKLASRHSRLQCPGSDMTLRHTLARMQAATLSHSGTGCDQEVTRIGPAASALQTILQVLSPRAGHYWSQIDWQRSHTGMVLHHKRVGVEGLPMAGATFASLHHAKVPAAVALPRPCERPLP
jgi:hypothetical protein